DAYLHWALGSSIYDGSTTAKKADGDIKYELCHAFGGESLEPLHCFLRLPWFQRRWVIQEAALSECHRIAETRILHGMLFPMQWLFFLGRVSMSIICLYSSLKLLTISQRIVRISGNP